MHTYEIIYCTKEGKHIRNLKIEMEEYLAIHIAEEFCLPELGEDKEQSLVVLRDDLEFGMTEEEIKFDGQYKSYIVIREEDGGEVKFFLCLEKLDCEYESFSLFPIEKGKLKTQIAVADEDLFANYYYLKILYREDIGV